jgi:hypothetical protein
VAKSSRAKTATSCCLFCGRPWTPGVVRKSKEHPLAGWIKQQEENHPPEHMAYSTGMILGADLREFVQVQPEITYTKAPLLTVHTREVCEDCNTGWMSALEETAKPVSLQMAQAAQSGIALALSRENARGLALWAQKMALAYELTSDTDRVGTAAMGQEVRAGRPLRGSQVWAARNTRDSDIGVALAQIDVSATPVPQPGPPDRRGLMVEIVYHHISMLIFIADSPGQAWPQLSPVKWTLVWPSFGMAEFPPLDSVTADERTDVLAKPGRWIPPVQVPVIQQPDLPPVVRRRN